MGLKLRYAIRMGLILPLVGAMMFVPAGSLHFWQGWVFLGFFLAVSVFMLAYFYRRDPRLLERRMQRKEQHREQKLFQRLWMVLWTCVLVLPGLDYRFGWSDRIAGGVPLWLAVFGQALMAVSWYLIFEVFRFNTFAAATIQVEVGQKVIATGPYGIVRHPMYAAIIVMIVATPLALGSYAALPAATLLIPVLLFRLVHEERFLRHDLPGYPEYCKHTRFRLVPHVW